MTDAQDKPPVEKKDWQQVEERVRSAWQEQPESAQSARFDHLSPKEIRLRPSVWVVRGLIAVLSVIVIVGAIFLVISQPPEVTPPPPRFDGGPPVKVLPAPAIGAQGAAVVIPTPTLEPEPAETIEPDAIRQWPTPAR